MVGFAPFRCFQQMDGNYSLVPSADLNCYDSLWWSNIYTVTIGLLQIILIPIVLMVVFRINRDKLHDNKFLWQFGSLTEGYVDQFYWWEVVVLLKKLIFVMVVDLSNDLDRHIRAYMAVIVLLSGMFFEYMFHPRKPEFRALHLV
jgi:hypothetical protein